MGINYTIIFFEILLLVVIITVILTLKFSRVRSEGFNYFVQYILDLLYFSRLQSPYLIKKRFYIPVTIGYLISAIAFIGTILSFIVSDDNQIRLFIAIIFTILLIATFLYDKLAKKTNDLIVNLNTDTKDLMYAYDELKTYEINRKFKSVFEDFTRYTSGIIGVQVYNYHLLSKKDTEAIKIEYEFGSVSEGASLNAILQEYYEYDRATKDALIRANRKMEYIETKEDIEQVLSEMVIIEEAIIKSDYSPSSVAFYMIFLERLLDYLNEYNELFGEELPQQSDGHSSDSHHADTLNQTTTHDKEFDTFSAEAEAAAATSSNDTEDIQLDFSRISHNYKNGLFKSVVYSDIIRTKEMFSFTYNGLNTSKAGRSYLFFKATSIKGETKLFLIVIKPEDLLTKKGKPYEDFVLEKFISILSAHELIDNDSINLLKGGTVYDTTKRYG